MSLKDRLQDTGVRGSDHQGSHTQTHTLKEDPEARNDMQGQSSGDARTQHSDDFAGHAHAGTMGTGSGQISPQTQGQPASDPSTGTIESAVVREGEEDKS